MFDHEELIKHHRPRANILANCILLSFSVILARLWYLQVHKGELLLNYSLRNRLRREIIRAPRGMLFDRQNTLIVDNIPRFDAVITPQYLKNKETTIEKLGEILDMTVPAIKKIISKKSNLARYKSIIIKKDITRREVAIIETENEDLPGVSVETFISRQYIDKKVGGHLLGYISEIGEDRLGQKRKQDNYDYKLGDFIGQAGLELQYDHFIRGTNGHEFVEVDATGRKKMRVGIDNLFDGIKNRPSVPGYNVSLTIDRDLQLAAFKALEGKDGAAVAVDVRTGEILAIVSRPSFDPAIFSRGLTRSEWAEISTNDRNPLRDRTIQEHYAPGSTYKPFVALAALEEGIIGEHDEFKCSGKLRLGRRNFHCWKKYGHRSVDVVRSIRESCDVFYYNIARKLDIDILAQYAKLFGLGNKTGISLPREVKGLVPTKEWKKKKNNEEWVLGETLSCVIGQSYMLASPLQLTMAYAAIANGGTLYRPYVVKEIFSNTGEVKKKYGPKVVSNIEVSPKNLEIVKKGLYQVNNHPRGTAYWRRGMGNSISGKTGTSQVIGLSAEKLFAKCEDTEYKFRHHGIYVGFAPFEEPKIAVGVVIEHGCHGSSAAGPVATAIISKYLEKYWPDLKKIYTEEQKKEMKAYQLKQQKKQVISSL